jgi:hypothetical protein
MANSLASGIVSAIPGLITTLVLNKVDNTLAKQAAERAAQEKLKQEAAEKLAKEAEEKLAVKALEEKAAKQAAADAAANAAKNPVNKALQQASTDAAERAAKEKAEKEAMDTAAAKAKAKAAALGEKNGVKKGLKKTQGFATKMKSIFPKLPMETQGRMGLRWSREAGRLDNAVSKAVGSSQLESKIAGMMAKEGGERAAARAAAASAKYAAKMAATANMGPIGALYDAITVVGMAMDMADIGGYMAVTQTSDFLKVKQQFDVMFQNVSLDCGSVPFGPLCQGAEPLPADTPPRAASFPQFFGPLDALQQNISIEDYLDLQTSNANAVIMSSANDAKALKARVVTAINTGTSDMDPIPGPVSNEDFLLYYPAFISEGDSTILSNMTLAKMCTTSGGRLFTPSQYIDPVCTYSTETACHGVSEWPPPSDDSVNYTYTEWRAKSYFDQFKNGDGTKMITAAPTQGACTVQSTSLHQMCDITETTSTGTAGNTYLRNTGECVNSKEYCKIKGISFKTNMATSQMGGLGSGPLPSCFIGANQEVLENIVGSGTIVRFFRSGGDIAVANQIATHIRPVSASSVHSGDATADAVFAGTANGLITATNALTGALASAAVAYLNQAKVVADNQFQAIATPISSIVSGNAGSIGTNVGNTAGNAIQAAKDIGTSFSRTPPDVAGGLAHTAEVAGLVAATVVSAAIAPVAAVTAGYTGMLGTAGTGNAANAVNRFGTQANQIATTATAIDAAANKDPPDIKGVLANTASTIAQGAAVVGSALAAPAAVLGAGVVSSFNTVNSGPVAAFNNLQNQADTIAVQGNKLDKALNDGNAGAVAQAAVTLLAQTAALAASAVVAPIASAAAEVKQYGAAIVVHPQQAVNSAANNVASSANAVQNAVNSGNSNQAAAAIANVVGDSLNVGATSIIAGGAIAFNFIKNKFTGPPPPGPWWQNLPTDCKRGYYGKCWGLNPNDYNSCNGIDRSGDCTCPGGTILHPSGDCQQPAWAIPCAAGWDTVLGKANLHDFCWSDAQNGPKRANKCCGKDPTWLAWAVASTCAAQRAQAAQAAQQQQAAAATSAAAVATETARLAQQLRDQDTAVAAIQAQVNAQAAAAATDATAMEAYVQKLRDQVVTVDKAIDAEIKRQEDLAVAAVVKAPPEQVAARVKSLQDSDAQDKARLDNKRAREEARLKPNRDQENLKYPELVGGAVASPVGRGRSGVTNTAKVSKIRADRLAEDQKIASDWKKEDDYRAMMLAQRIAGAEQSVLNTLKNIAKMAVDTSLASTKQQAHATAQAGLDAGLETQRQRKAAAATAATAAASALEAQKQQRALAISQKEAWTSAHPPPPPPALLAAAAVIEAEWAAGAPARAAAALVANAARDANAVAYAAQEAQEAKEKEERERQYEEYRVAWEADLLARLEESAREAERAW